MIIRNTVSSPIGGGIDLKANWWNGDIGASGAYLTTQFRDSIFRPAMKTIVNTIEEMAQELRQSYNYDELFLAGNVFIIMIIAMSWFLIHKKISEIERNHQDNIAQRD